MSGEPHIRIEPARPADVPDLLRLIRALAEYERLAQMVTATEARLRDTLFGERRYAEALMARADGRPAGFALFFHNYSTFLARPGIYLEDLFVEPSFRGRGIGKRLLARIAAIAVERDCGRCEWSVLDWNEAAIGFYRKLGARPMDDWTVFRVDGPVLAALAASAS